MLKDVTGTDNNWEDNGFYSGSFDTDFVDEPLAKNESTANDNNISYNYDDDSDYENEPPLLEELGINFGFILKKTSYVIVPRTNLDVNVLSDGDITGPLIFFLIFGWNLLLTGKVHFGYIFGFGILGSLLMNLLLNLLSSGGVEFIVTISILGYSILPVLGLSALYVFYGFGDWIGFSICFLCVLWSTITATRFTEQVANCRDQRYLIAYPMALFYTLFVVITVW